LYSWRSASFQAGYHGAGGDALLGANISSFRTDSVTSRAIPSVVFLVIFADRRGSLPVACNAHARRKFYEARGSDALRSHQALAYYRQLYELERQAKDFSDEQRLQMRQDLAVPILGQFRAWLEGERPEVLPKSPMAEAIAYALNNWAALVRYTEAGFLAIDNNAAEREMKRIAIGRKNWLSIGSPRGGQTAAVLFSFTSTCQRLGVEPWRYLRAVLERLPSHPTERLAELLPDEVSVHGARVTAVQSGLGIGTATRQPLWLSGTQVDAPASMRTTPGLGGDFLHKSLPSAWPHSTRRQDASAWRSSARWALQLARRGR
jgi:hypothetical protein